jgi:hypothetical protein
MKRNKIIKHYKSFFKLENIGLAEDDHLMIDWVESLVKDCNLHIVNGSASGEDSEPQIDYHVQRVKAFNHYLKDRGNLAARVFLRATGAINNSDGTYTIQERDIKEWFESGSYLKAFTEYDTM